MKLLVTGKFATTVTVQGDQRRFAAVEGQIFEVDEQTGLALLRDVGPYVREVGTAAVVFAAIGHADVLAEAETVAEENVVEMVEVPPEIATPARTRQIAKRPGPKPTARKKK